MTTRYNAIINGVDISDEVYDIEVHWDRNKIRFTIECLDTPELRRASWAIVEHRLGGDETADGA